MDKNLLKERIDEVKNNLITNSKDAHWTKNAIDELLSLKGQLEHEPTLLYVPTKDIEKQAEGETFTMAITKDGKAIYHTYGGYTVVADASYSALFDTIYNLIDYMNGTVELDEETSEILKGDTIATSYILSMPIFVMGDFEYKVQLFDNLVGYLNKSVSEVEQELQEETPKENREFKDAAIALETLKSE